MKKRNVLLLVILLVIGFAAVSTTLILNGTIGVGTNNDDFDVIFISAILDGEESSKAIISEDKKSITFTSNKLTKLNETSRLDYKVKNNSTQYGADVTISCNTTGNEYVSITSKFADTDLPITTPIEMSSQEVKDGYISAELIKAYVGEDDKISITCNIVANATEKDKKTDFVPYKVYKEDILNGTDPVLTSSSKTRSANNKELIPITLANDGTVTYANIENKWYSYANKEWANAVILIDNPSKNYKVNDVIKEDDIESYFVWVPRYRYQIFDEGNYTETINEKLEASKAQEINIKFESKDVAPSTGSTKDSWLTHPAFTNFDVNGLWVGKFETGYKSAETFEAAQVTAVDSSRVIVKPNVYSWRYNTVANMFKTAYNYNRELDSHMMKNTEWGAVAYLSHSKYGINGEININNNSDFLTGYSAVDGTDQSSYPGTYGTDETITLPYNTPTGYKASTTGNITGVYDMSGGAIEYVAAYMEGYGVESNATTKISSGFTENELTTYASYLDKYLNTSSLTSYNNRILGDSTGEVGPFYFYADKDNYKRFHNNWYADLSDFVDPIYPWFGRSGFYADGVISGQFYFARFNGGIYDIIGSRLVLAI